MGAAVVRNVMRMVQHRLLGSELKYEETDRATTPAARQTASPLDASRTLTHHLQIEDAVVALQCADDRHATHHPSHDRVSSVQMWLG